MQGRRVDQPINDPQSLWLAPGDYGRATDGRWLAIPPGENRHLLANVSKHEVTEHEDGTITVSPSILVSNHTGTWHGYLERGVWREC